MKSNATAIRDMLFGKVLSVTAFRTFLANRRNADLVHFYNMKLRKADKVIALIGDSYGVNYVNRIGIWETYSWETNRWSGWADAFRLLFPDVKVYASAVGGAGFIGANEKTFEAQLTNLFNKMNDGEELSDVIVLGGYNDMASAGTEADLEKAVSGFSKKVYEKYPGSKVSFMYIPVDYNDLNEQKKLHDYCEIFRRICRKNDIVFVENSDKILGSEDLIFWYEGDENSGLHPNSKGCRKISLAIAEYLVSGHIAP